MKLTGYIYLFPLLCLLLASCEKEEKPVVLPPKPEEVKLLSVDMGKDYTDQIFVNISSGKTTTISNLSWDLAFDASAAGITIYQNSGKNILTANTGTTQFKPYPDLKSMIWKWDEASGHKDSLALKGCITTTGQATDSVYLVRINASVYYQFRIKNVTPAAYTVEVSDPAQTWVKETIVSKDPTKNQVYFSFADGGTYMNPEPEKNDWHICFLRYRWIYYEFNPPLLYLVSGVFINTATVTAVQDSVVDFYNVTKADCAAKTFLSRRDVIGFTWKSPDLSNTSNVKYTIRKDYYYFIREHAGDQRLFKIRFIDFYNDQGVKGSPKFEVQQLD
jgi:hypothetical protein